MAETSAGAVHVSLVLDTSQAERGLMNFKKTAVGFAKKMAGAFGLAMGAKAMLDFSKSCLQLGSDLAEVQNVVDVVFPTMNGAVDDFAKNAAAQFGLSETMAKKYVGTFGSMAEAFGFTEAQALEMSETLTGLAGDVASFYNMSQDEAYTKLKSVFSGETETLKELGIVMTQSALDQYALANGLGRTTSQMSEAEKVSLRYMFVQEQLTNATGDFARTSGSWANQVRLLSLQWESFKATIGQSLITVLTPAISAFNVLMSKIVAAAQMFNSFLSVLGFKKQNPIANAANSTESLSSGLGNVASAGNSAAKSAGKTNKAAKALKRTLAGFDQINKLDKAESSSGGSSGGSGGGGGGGAGLSDFTADTKKSTSAADAFMKKWKKFINDNPALVKAWRRLVKVLRQLGKILRQIGRWITKHVIKPFGKWMKQKFLPVFIETIASAFEAIVAVLKLLKPIFKFLWKNFIKPFVKQVGKMVIERLKLAKSFFEQIASVANKLRGAGETVKEFFSSIGDVKDGAVADIKVDIATKWEDIKDKWEGITSHISDKTASMRATVGTIWSNISTAWTNVTKNIKDKTASMKAKVGTTWSSIRSKWTKLLGHFKDKTVKIGLKFSAAAQDLKSWINNNVISRINSKFQKVPILKNHLIPKLAEGGFVRANTPQLAMIGDNRHQGEFVAPERKLMEMAQMAASMAGAGDNAETVALLKQIVTFLANLDLSATVSGTDLTNLVVRMINQRTKSTGRSPLYL